VLLLAAGLRDAGHRGVWRELWTGISGSTVGNLRTAASFAAPAQTVSLVPGEFLVAGTGDNYGQRLSGIFTAPVTANYSFSISSDDSRHAP
jgi:hypothetical protein